MPSRLVDVITSADAARRDSALSTLCEGLDRAALLDECAELDAFWRSSENLYERVRALFFLYAIHRFHLPRQGGVASSGRIPFDGVSALWGRRFREAIDLFLAAQDTDGPTEATCSALAAGYRHLGFQTLADQVRQSVRSVEGNRWMFQVERAASQPLRIHRALLEPDEGGANPVLVESTPVRMDLTHSGWSDIFFLGMDYPEGARVLNVSIDLGVRGRDPSPQPPIQTYLRVIDQPILRLISVDLDTVAEISELEEVFDFAKDYLGLLKAAVISAGLVPPSLEGTGERLDELLRTMVGPGAGLEITSQVHGIPKGSRLAVSTNLLASLIALCMRASGQTEELTGPLAESERRLIAARAILGEWLGGSGGGWQDSGGLWPSIKLIEGALAVEGDPEFGISRGRLLPDHALLGLDAVPRATRDALMQSLVLVHGGMAQDVGPILEMVTEKYLLRTTREWEARQAEGAILQRILDALRNNDVRALGEATHDNFAGPITAIIPWATNDFTERLIERVRSRFGDRFWGFWMLGGMSGGGMGLLFEPRAQPVAVAELPELMVELKREFEDGLPFAMDPVVYDFAINDEGTVAEVRDGDAPLPRDYYAMRVPRLLRQDPGELTPQTRLDLRRFGMACSKRQEFRDMPQTLFDELFPEARDQDAAGPSLDQLLVDNGFDPQLHEEIRSDLRSGRIGLARNRLPADTVIEDVRPEDVIDASQSASAEIEKIGSEALAEGSVAVVTLSAGLGTRWTQGAGVVKALHPFCQLGGAHRTFLEVHLAKSRRAAQRFGTPPPHVITTSYLTHAPIEAQVTSRHRPAYAGEVLLSQGRSVGLRLVPMQRDLRFLWEETEQQILDEQAQKVKESLQSALVAWAGASGEASDYRDNLPVQCLHPVGHWYEVPNLLLNGTLAALLRKRPQLRTLLLHNVDTLGADLDPGVLGRHLDSGAALTFEVVPRRIEDRGGGLARVNGRPRLVESLALPREEDEYRLSFYNSMTTWIDIDAMLRLFDLERGDLEDAEAVSRGVRRLARRMPTYITLKDVKKRWGHGQEDVFPVAQFEKLWSDMTSLEEANCRFIVVPRFRGQQLKEIAQLDAWTRDGSAGYVDSICAWQ